MTGRLNILCLLILTFILFDANGQAKEGATLKIYGKIINAIDSTPVGAKITFESLPDNRDVHVIESSDSSGLFTAILHEQADYSILVDAEYYKPEMDTIKSEDIGRFDILYRLLPVKAGDVLQLQKIYFPQGDYTILESSYGELTELIYLLKEYPDMEIRLEGHTDRQGGAKSNMILSENRVKSIRTYLVQHGISEKRIKIKAFGGTRPVSLENTEAARQANRRVEVRILKI
jgi:OmpA-OmpF porin, OOP family